MDKIEYKGKEYKRYREKWVDEWNLVVSDSMQRELNYFFSDTQDCSQMSVREIIEQADKYKRSCSYALAVKLYEKAMDDADIKDAEYILPRITSCYRALGRPEKAVELLSFSKKHYGNEIVSVALLCSAAAAYCDMMKVDEARKCCDRANRMNDGKNDEIIKGIYSRINSISKE